MADACGGVVVADARDAAARGGLRAGDRIVRLNGGVPLDVLDVEDAAADGTLWLSVLRDGHPLDLAVTPEPGRVARDLAGPRRARRRPADLPQRLPLLLRRPGAARPARRSLRQGRRLPSVVPARQLHDAHQPGRGRSGAHRGAAPLTALRVAARLGRRRPRPSHGAGGGRLSRRPRTARRGRPRAAPAGRALPGLERRGRARRDGAAHRRAGRTSPTSAWCRCRWRPRATCAG